MRNFNRSNITGLEGSSSNLPAPPQVTQMGLEKAADIAKVIGFVVIGFWLVGAVGFILQSIFGGRSRADRINKMLNGIEGDFKLFKETHKTTKINRQKLVDQLVKNNGTINRLIGECVNEGPLWKTVDGLIKRTMFFFVEKVNILDAAAKVDTLYISRDEKTFPNRAMDLAKELNGSAAHIKSELGELARELNKAGYKIENQIYFRSSFDDLEGLRKEAVHLSQLYDHFIEFASEEWTADRLSVKGEFEIKTFIEGVSKEIDIYEKQAVNADKVIREIEKIKVDKDEVKQFINSSDQVSHANEVLTMNLKMLALATKIRAGCQTASLRTEEAMLGALSNTLKAEYKKQPAGKGIGVESIGTPVQFQALRGDIVQIGDRILSENNVAFSTLLNVGTIIVREAGIQAELGGDAANKFKDEDVVRLLAARIQNRLKV